MNMPVPNPIFQQEFQFNNTLPFQVRQVACIEPSNQQKRGLNIPFLMIIFMPR
ncbi:hypothetical protein HQ585_17995 [candidate division KSB1 bacterium]|nr:hypothetical protein [candidate division KSB1 bacterium]